MKGAFLILLLLIPIALAGTISLTTILTSDLVMDKGEIQVILTNSGSESAYNVQLSVLSDGFSSDPIYVGILKPNIPFETNLSISPKELSPGNYPIIVMTEYADANGYPFSSVSPIIVSYKNPSVSMVSGMFSDVSLSGKKSKNLALTLKNSDDKSHGVTVKLILPKELGAEEEEKIVNIGSKQEKTLNFKVSNFAGLTGSSYVVLASMEYDDERHYSSFTRGMIKIGNVASQENKGHIFSNVKPMGYIILLISIFIILSYFRHRIKFKKK